MENHKRVLGILYIISGVFQIIGMLLVSMLIRIFIPFILEQPDMDGARWVVEFIVPFISFIAGAVIILFSIPAIIGGWGLLNQKSWAMSLLLVLGCFKLFSFPIGTALGIYTIWVYLESKKLQPA